MTPPKVKFPRPIKVLGLKKVFWGPPKHKKLIFSKKPQLRDLTKHWRWFPQWPWSPGYHQTPVYNSKINYLAVAQCEHHVVSYFKGPYMSRFWNDVIIEQPLNSEKMIPSLLKELVNKITNFANTICPFRELWKENQPKYTGCSHQSAILFPYPFDIKSETIKCIF